MNDSYSRWVKNKEKAQFSLLSYLWIMPRKKFILIFSSTKPLEKGKLDKKGMLNANFKVITWVICAFMSLSVSVPLL